jgi:hypothetical protein
MDALVVASDEADARAAGTSEPTPSSQARLRTEVVTLMPPAFRHATIRVARHDPLPLSVHIPGVLVIERLDRRPGL